jgi:hypothetical protein
MICLCTVASLFSQSQPLQPKQKNTRFQSYNAFGVLTGESGVSVGIQSVNGVQWKSFFIGGGLGLDFYGIGTTPVFLDMRKTFGKSKRQFFVYGDLGAQFAWPGRFEAYDGSNEKPDLRGGLYTDIGLGYLAGIGKNDALVLSVGYTYKTLTEKIMAYPLCLPGVPCEPTQAEDIYRFNRISLKIGWRF